MQRELDATVATMSSIYVQLADENVAQLQAGELEARQSRYLQDVITARTKLDVERDLLDRVSTIQEIQRSSHAFLRSVTEEQAALKESDAFRNFARGMQEKGEVRRHISTYNDLVGIMNDSKGTLVSSVTGVSNQPTYPLLRFDGSDPDIGIITLGN